MTYPTPYSGICTFLRATTQLAEQKFIVQGIPLDCGTTNRPGARLGPRAIRQASMMLTDGFHPLYRNDPTAQIVDVGDILVTNSELTKNIELIDERTRSLFLEVYHASPHIISMGGDHSVTLGLLRAMATKHPDINLIHIDAHNDCSPSNFGANIGHGTWLRNAVEEGLVDPKRVVSMGMRAPTSLSGLDYLTSRGGYSISGWQASQMSAHDMAVLLKRTLDPAIPTYLSFDIDGLDPSCAPGTGTPEIGGLRTDWALALLSELREFNWIGMDLVEVAPAYDHSEITALAAATIMYWYVCMNAVE